MKKFGSKSGFTLVELIVVIAILGILAGIAVPAYSGYITKANEAADLTQLDAIKTAVIFAYTEKSVEDPDMEDLESITVTESGVTTTPSATIDISPYYDMSSFEFKSDATTAKWTAADQAWELK